MKTLKTILVSKCALFCLFIFSFFFYSNGFSQPLVFCGGELDEAPCTGEVDLVPEENPNCPIDSISWVLDLNADTFQIIDEGGVNALQARIPLGTHTVKFFIKGRCGEERIVEKTFEIIDCTPPELTCYQDLSIDIYHPNGRIEVWPEDFVATAYDNCSGYNYEARIYLVEDNNDDGNIDSLDYLQGPPKFETAFLYCRDVGKTRLVHLWISEVSNDSINNWSNCVTKLEVQDRYNFCGDYLVLRGKVENYYQQPLENINIVNSNGYFGLTDSTGYYTFIIRNFGEDFRISAEKTSSAVDGVTTVDLALIGKHILGQKTLYTPYQLLAADVNQSGTITTMDLILIRKIILGLEINFPGNKNWIFIPEEFDFPDPENPWEYETEIILYNLFRSQYDLNFIGLKLGDVNGTAR